jgi:E3 ubiquitin-protein ligase DOA10
MAQENSETVYLLDPPNIDLCRYCLSNQTECNSIFINPCKCTNPICESCLKIQLEYTHSKICEICRSPFVITNEMKKLITDTDNPNNELESNIPSGTEILFMDTDNLHNTDN